MYMSEYLVEFLGTLIFLYVIITTGNYLAIGLSLSAMIIVGGSISGGHFNPAVTIMMAVAGKHPNNEVIPYILAQVSGGLVALEMSKSNLFK